MTIVVGIFESLGQACRACGFFAITDRVFCRTGTTVFRFDGAHPFVDGDSQLSRGTARGQIEPARGTLGRGDTKDEDEFRPIKKAAAVRAFEQRQRIEFSPNGGRELKPATGDPEPFDAVVADPRKTEAMVRTRSLKRSRKATQSQPECRFTKTDPTEKFIE
jgi:hypothetical protein